MEDLAKRPAALGTLRQRIFAELLEDLEVPAARLTGVLVGRHVPIIGPRPPTQADPAAPAPGTRITSWSVTIA
jgi:hypothetical protein